MIENKRVDPRLIVGEFVLADADDDIEKAVSILQRVADGEISSTVMLMQMGQLVAGSLRAAYGDNWRAMLNAEMLALSVEGVTGDE